MVNKASKKSKKPAAKKAAKKGAKKPVTVASLVLALCKSRPKMTTREMAEKILKSHRKLFKNPNLVTAKNTVAWYRSRYNVGKLAAASFDPSSSITWNPKAKKPRAKKGSKKGHK